MEPILTGIKVLDLGNYIAGPFTGMLLADQGAEVIKVERPSGDPGRVLPGFVVWNRAKRGITLDLKQKAGQLVAQALARTCDVVIHNFKPGASERLGVDYETLASKNPGLVYCSITGFGESGPYRDEPGWDSFVYSATSTYLEQGGTSESPTYIVLPMPSYYGALMAAFSVTTALYVRGMTGRGQKVEVPLLNAMTAVQHTHIMDMEGMKRIAWSPEGNRPFCRLYQAGDGQWMHIATLTNKLFTSFAQLVNRDDWLVDPLFDGAPMIVPPPRDAEVQQIIAEVFATKPRDEWLALLQEELPIAEVRRIEEFLDDPQVAANEMVIELADPNVGRVRQMGIPVKFSVNPGKVRGPSPTLGQHTNEVLGDFGFSSAEINELRRTGVI